MMTMILAKSGRIEFDVSYAWIMRSISASDRSRISIFGLMQSAYRPSTRWVHLAQGAEDEL